MDDFDYAYTLPGTTRPALHKDVIQLSTREATEKLAVSFALAQSAKLGVFEVRACAPVQGAGEPPSTLLPLAVPEIVTMPFQTLASTRSPCITNQNYSPLLYCQTTIEKTIAETREIPERMARTGKISLKRRDITQRIGQVCVWTGRGMGE